MDGWMDGLIMDDDVSFLLFGSKYEKEWRLRYKGYVDTRTIHSSSFWRDFHTTPQFNSVSPGFNLMDYWDSSLRGPGTH